MMYKTALLVMPNEFRNRFKKDLEETMIARIIFRTDNETCVFIEYIEELFEKSSYMTVASAEDVISIARRNNIRDIEIRDGVLMFPSKGMKENHISRCDREYNRDIPTIASVAVIDTER